MHLQPPFSVWIQHPLNRSLWHPASGSIASCVCGRRPWCVAAANNKSVFAACFPNWTRRAGVVSARTTRCKCPCLPRWLSKFTCFGQPHAFVCAQIRDARTARVHRRVYLYQVYNTTSPLSAVSSMAVPQRSLIACVAFSPAILPLRLSTSVLSEALPHGTATGGCKCSVVSCQVCELRSSCDPHRN